MKQTYPSFLFRKRGRQLLALPFYGCLVLLLSFGSIGPVAAQVAGRAQTQPPRFFRADAAAARMAVASPLVRSLRQYRAYSLDLPGLRAALAAAPLRSGGTPLEISLPLPDGTSQRFAVRPG